MDNNSNAPLSKARFYRLPAEVKFEDALSDGVFYNADKLAKVCREQVEKCQQWLDRKVAEGLLVRYKDGSGNYRMPYRNVIEHYKKRGLPLDKPIAVHLYAPRVWGEMTEAEGFLKAPLKEVSYVTFKTFDMEIVGKIIEALRGVAKVKIVEPGVYRAYCASSKYVRSIIVDAVGGPSVARSLSVRGRNAVMRREFVDLDPDFAEGMLLFYIDFARLFTKGHKETINLFLERNEQGSQMAMWVLQAIEKFNEAESVPFSGYLASVLQRWPYDLPSEALGADVARYQRRRKKMLERTGRTSVDHELAAEHLGLSVQQVRDYETRHLSWLDVLSAKPLIWDDSAEEKVSEGSVFSVEDDDAGREARLLSHNVSRAALSAVALSGALKDLTTFIQLASEDDLAPESLSVLDPRTVAAFQDEYVKLGGAN